MGKRKTISVRARFEIFKRDSFTCQYCRSRPPQVVLNVDHIIPVSDRGDNHTTNLTTACEACNSGKSNIPLSSMPASLEAMAEEAAERRAQMEACAAFLQKDREAFEDDCWAVADHLKRDASRGYSSHNFRSVKMFVRRLGYARTLDAAQIAADRWPEGTRRFKYFCGICWRRIKELEGEA